MRIKIFTAATMNDALAEVRSTLGQNAVIINTEEKNDSFTITAATEPPPRTDTPTFKQQRTLLRTTTAPKNGRFIALGQKPAPKQARLAPAPIRHSLKELEEAQKIEDDFDLESFLIHHGISGRIRQEILSLFDAIDKENSLMNLAAVIDSLFAFCPLNNDYAGRPIMMVGPPGAGKTVTAAKLASQAVLNGYKCHLISTDVIRTGGFTQLMGYAEVLKMPISKISTAGELKSILEEIKHDGDLVIIDTAGYNPFNAEEMQELHSYIEAGNIEPIFIAPAGTAPLDAQEMSETYAALGAKRFIPTKLDVARRYGSLITTAQSKHLSFAGAGITPFLADGLQSLDPLTLAKLLTKISRAKAFKPKSSFNPDHQE